MRSRTFKDALRHFDRRPIWTGLEAASGPVSSLAIALGLTATIGSEGFGTLVMLLAASNMAAAMAPAVSAATLRAIASAVGRAGGLAAAETEIARLLASGLSVIATIALLVIVVAAAGQQWIVEALSSAYTDAPPPAVLLMIVVAVAAVQFDGVIGATIRARERFRAQALMELAAKALLAAGVVLVALLGGDLYAIAATYCLICVTAPCARIIFYRTLVGARTLIARPLRSHYRDLLGFGGWMWLNALATAAFTSLDRLYVGVTLGSAKAAEYTIFIQIAQFVHFVPASLAAFSFPVWSRLEGTSGAAARSEAIALFWRVMVLAQSVAFVLAGSVLLSGALLRDHVQSMLGFAGDTQPLVLLLGAFALLGGTIAPYYYELARGNARLVAWITISGIVLSLVLMIVLTPVLGLAGTAYARFGYVAVALVLIPLAWRHIGQHT